MGIFGAAYKDRYTSDGLVSGLIVPGVIPSIERQVPILVLGFFFISDLSLKQ